MTLPIPRETQLALPAGLAGASNLKALLDRYVGDWGSQWEFNAEKAAQFYVKVAAGAGNCGTGYDDFAAEWKSVLAQAGAMAFNGVTASRLAIGLGNETVLENGMTLHPVRGVPYIPGSAVRGCLRNWYIHEILCPAVPGEGADVIDTLLMLDDEALKKGRYGSSRPQLATVAKLRDWPEFYRARELFGSIEYEGQLICYDALPVAFPRLDVDILNPHYPDYYSKGDSPGDWQSPYPVRFLTVAAATRFLFGYRCRPAGGRPLSVTTDEVAIWLQMMLTDYGIGGKTAVGYGVFDTFSPEDLALVRKQESERIQLVEQERRLAAMTPLQRDCIAAANAADNELHQLCAKLKEYQGAECQQLACALKKGYQRLKLWDHPKNEKQKKRIAAIGKALGEK